MDNLLLAKCLRCRGTVAYEKFYGHKEQFWGCKCGICGETMKPVLAENWRLIKAGQEMHIRRAIRT